MEGGGLRPNETVLTTRKRPGSDIIRKRVAQPQLLQSSSAYAPVGLDSPRDNSIGRPDSMPGPDIVSNESDARNVLPPTPNTSRSLKRKKSTPSISQVIERPENRNAHVSKVSHELPFHSSSSRFSANMSPSDHQLPLISSQKKSKSLNAKHSSHQQHDCHITRAYHESDSGSAYRHSLSGEPVFTGPLAVAEFERMKKEIETLKEALHETKKTSKRHVKKLEENKAELNAALSVVQAKESELSTVKDKHKKAEETLSTIESSVQCQICMDLPDKPFALSPCGHILCLSCLQEWFRKAPPTLDDMDVDPDELTDPHYILMRSKSCPSCRATVKRRPVPVFMVKAVVSILKKRDPTISGRSLGASAPDSENLIDADNDDPWKGIFASSDEDEDDADEDEDDADEDDEDDDDLEADSEDEDDEILMGWYREEFRRALFPDLDTDSDGEGGEDDLEEEDEASDSSEDEDAVYVLPRWAPPRVIIDPTQYNISQSSSTMLKLLQRGCSFDMIRDYDLAYHHRRGITLSLRSLNSLFDSDDERIGDEGHNVMNRIYLSWNISLDRDDVNGQLYIAEVLEDIKNHPLRWQMKPRRGGQGAMDVRRLVRADEVEDYDTTDTEIWIDAEDF